MMSFQVAFIMGYSMKSGWLVYIYVMRLMHFKISGSLSMRGLPEKYAGYEAGYLKILKGVFR
jgi:hypothetical protein